MSIWNPKSPYAGRVIGVAHKSGIMAAGLAANSEIFQFRHADTSARTIRILAVNLSVAADSVAFTAGAGHFDLVPARAWTVDGSGGAAAVFTTNNGKFRTANTAADAHSADSARGSTTAALTAGTKTLDNQGVAALAAGFTAVAGQLIVQRENLLTMGVNLDNEPLVLANQEGFVIRADVPATGTWKFAVDVIFADLSQ
jgi:hypothetical protein